MFRRSWALAPLVVFLAACSGIGLGGGTDRIASARAVEAQYWKDIGSGNISKAYTLLSTGQQQNVSLFSFRQSMFAFLEQSSGISTRVGKPTVVGDCALVPVELQSAKAPGNYFHAAQHMYWVNGQWRITEMNGGLYNGKAKLTSCPTGT